MKIKLTKGRKWLLGGSLVLLTATPSFALFGLGDIVFDPTSYASLVSQLTTLQTQYTMLKNNLTHFSVKQQWQVALHQLENLNIASMFGETAGIKVALSSNSPSMSLTGWKAATLPMSPGTSTYLQRQPVDGAQRAALAMIETSDGISPDCLTAIGQYRAARSQNATANASLAVQQLDSSDSTNTEVEQLNLLNAAAAQQMAEAQSQGLLQTCLASQMTVANMQQRNAAVADLNTAAFVQAQRQNNNVNAVNESNTWATYLP